MSTRVRSSTLCVCDSRLLMVRLRDPKTHVVRFVPPGGSPEPEETLPATARRETLEETGYEVAIDEKCRFSLAYDYEWNGTVYHCLTHFFRAVLISSERKPVHDEDFVVGSEWVALERVGEELSFHPTLSTAICDFLKKNTKTKSF